MRKISVVPIIFALIACSAATSTPITDVIGTWGGDNAGMIVNGTDVHVHIGCTLGDALGPIHPDANGHFEVAGTYNVDAYPVNRGITHPASFTGAHHTGFSFDLTVEHLEDFAEMAGIEFLLINNDTTISGFKKELRWNDMYYALAKGL